MIGSPSVRKLLSNCFTPGEAVRSATCLWRWKYQNPPGDELKTSGIQSVGCLVTPDAEADKRQSREPESYLGVIEGDLRLHIRQMETVHLICCCFSQRGEIRVHAWKD